MTTQDGIFTPSPTPKPHPRVKPEASLYADRNKGDNSWFCHDHQGNDDYHAPRPKERICSDEARRNAQVNKGSLGALMAGKMNGAPDVEIHNRVKPEAEEYANRNRGAMERWFDYGQNQNYNSPRPGERLRSQEAKDIAEVNKGVMNDCMGGYADPPVNRNVQPRSVKPEASEMAQKGRGGAMKNLMENYGNLGISDRNGPKVKGYEAEENAERNKGTVSKLMNNYADVPLPDPPAPKVSYGGQEVQEKYQGKDMGPMIRMEGQLPAREPKVSKLHQVSDGPGWDENPPAVRSRPEADRVAEKYERAHTENLRVMDMDVTPPTVHTPKLPKHMQESEISRPQSSPYRTRPEAMHNYQKNHSSEMASIMHGNPSQQVTPRKVNRMMMRSEDW